MLAWSQITSNQNVSLGMPIRSDQMPLLGFKSKLRLVPSFHHSDVHVHRHPWGLVEVSSLLYLGKRAANLYRHFVCLEKTVPMNMKAQPGNEGGPEDLK